MSDFVTDLLPHQWELVRKVILASPLTPKTKPNVSRDKLAQVITYFESRGNVPTSRQEAFFDQFEKIGKSPTSHEADRAINSILEGSEADEYRLLALKDQPKNLSTFSRKLQMIRIRAMANVEEVRAEEGGGFPSAHAASCWPLFWPRSRRLLFHLSFTLSPLGFLI